MSVHSAFRNQGLPSSDTDFIHQLRTRNEKAFTKLYKAYSPAILKSIKSAVTCCFAAEEILQNVFLKIWLHIHNYNCEKSSLFTWMVSIARNETIDYLRSKQEKNRKLTDSISECEMRTETFIELRFDRMDLLRSISRLPVKERTILELYNTGFTCRQVSKLLSIPEGTVKTNMRRSYVMLRKKYA